MLTIVVLLTLLLRFAMVFAYSITFLQQKHTNKVMIIVSSVIFLLSNMQLSDHGSQYYLNIAGDLGIALIVFGLFNGTLLKKIFHYLFLMMLMTCQNHLLGYLLRYDETPWQFSVAGTSSELFVYSLSLLSLFFLVLILLFYRFKEDTEVVLSNQEYLLLAGVPFFSSVILLITQDETLSLNRGLLLNFAVLAINLLTIFFSNYLVRKTQALNQQFFSALQNDYYERRFAEIQQIKIQQHDQKNTLLAVQELINRQENHQAAIAIAELMEKPAQTQQHFTDNWVIDTILTSKVDQMISKQLPYVIETRIPSNLDLSPIAIELFGIIGNVLDNAIEETARYPKQTAIKINAFFKDNKLIFEVVNYTETAVADFQPDTVLSVKAAGRIGLGLRSIKQRTKKLEGYCDFSISNQEFTALIVIPINSQ
ncbi:GHKL domain-containing protein [Enterococcus sp. AZ109]|uniref:GHKL domain-containing protein n=1 Tax=Enterococcus sp. AZ109 TaxID=2774634 RepID=UPI003F234B84